jgi:HAD superfamily phosphatase (TIGR01668 family)
LLVKPSLVIDDITALDLNALKAQGIRGFIFDLDNTIVAPHAIVPEARITAWLTILQAEGFRCIVLSNNKKHDYCRQAETALGIPVIAAAAKPRRAAFRKALELLDLQATEVAMVGDRPLTDIWVGQRMGSYTILVDPLIKKSEKVYIQWLRRLERLFLKATDGR